MLAEISGSAEHHLAGYGPSLPEDSGGDSIPAPERQALDTAGPTPRGPGEAKLSGTELFLAKSIRSGMLSTAGRRHLARAGHNSGFGKDTTPNPSRCHHPEKRRSGILARQTHGVARTCAGRLMHGA